MRKIREILRLKWECHCSNQLIARSVGASSSTISECLRRAQEAQLNWPLPEAMDDEKLSALLYPAPQKISPEQRGEIDWTYIHRELQRKHMTLMLLWQEYKEKYPQGIRYSRFCECYHLWSEKLDVWMRQTHKLGEKCFVDYAGTKMPIVLSVKTGELRYAEIFVATLGASNYTFAEATWTQQLPDWIASHVKAFEFFGGTPEIIVPDNLKSGVAKAHRYEPDINPTYQDMACHYGIAILPARIYSPQDKAKVENAVLQVERQILAKLRDKTFFNLYELNKAIRRLLNDFNQRPFQKIPGCRHSQFYELEKPSLRRLPQTRYQFAEWKKARAGADYHVELDDRYYSVPYTFIKKELDVRYTNTCIEIFYKGKRIASHFRNAIKNTHTTCKEHMPKQHQLYAEWTPERIIAWAAKTGVFTAKLVEEIMASRAHPQQGFRSCLGILRLSKSYGEARLESACHRALDIGAHTYKSIESILKNGLDQNPLPQQSDLPLIPADHEYIRGQNYFE
jgi:transposase